MLARTHTRACIRACVGLRAALREAQASWEADVSQYLQDEDDDSYAISPRVAAQQLLYEAASHTVHSPRRAPSVGALLTSVHRVCVTQVRGAR